MPEIIRLMILASAKALDRSTRRMRGNSRQATVLPVAEAALASRGWRTDGRTQVAMHWAIRSRAFMSRRRRRRLQRRSGVGQPDERGRRN